MQLEDNVKFCTHITFPGDNFPMSMAKKSLGGGVDQFSRHFRRFYAQTYTMGQWIVADANLHEFHKFSFTL